MSGSAANGLLEALGSEAHLWLMPIPEGAVDAPVEAWEALLSADETTAWRRFRVERPRLQFLAGRALARTTLSRYVGVDPAAWRFRLGPHGRPEIDGPAGQPPLRFNLSHTDGWVACLVTLRRDAGVDVEWLRQIRDPLAVAEHSFSPAEVAEVASRRGASRQRRFFDYWTLKEAYVKARGEGVFSLGTRRFTFQLPGGGALGVEFDPELGDRADAWQFALAELTPEHRLAVAIRRDGDPVSVVSRRVVPGRSEPVAHALSVLAAFPGHPSARDSGPPG